MDPYQTFAIELEDLRTGRVSIDALWNRYNAKSEREVNDFTTILAFVEHYVTDEDIRDQDSDYQQMQESEFDRLLSLLRSGRIAEAKRITFLQSTG